MTEIKFKDFFENIQGQSVLEYAKLDTEDLSKLIALTTGYAIKEFIKL